MLINGKNYTLFRPIDLKTIFQSDPCEGQLKNIITFAINNNINSLTEPISEKILINAFELSDTWLEYAIENGWLGFTIRDLIMGQVYRDSKLKEYWVFDLDDYDSDCIICHNISDRVMFTKFISNICEDVESNTHHSFKTTDEALCIEAFDHYFGVQLQDTGKTIYDILLAQYRK